MRIPVTTTKTQELGSFLKDFNWHCPSWNLHTAGMKCRHCHLLAIGSTLQPDRPQGRLSHKERQISFSGCHHSLLNERSLQTPWQPADAVPTLLFALLVSAPPSFPLGSCWLHRALLRPQLSAGLPTVETSNITWCLTEWGSPQPRTTALLYPHST